MPASVGNSTLLGISAVKIPLLAAVTYEKNCAAA
jgi:hypothetical protein